MKKEQSYDFKQKLLTVHEKNVRDFSYMPEKEMLSLADGVMLDISEAEDVVVRTAALDFIDFLSVSMNVSCGLGTEEYAKDKIIIKLAFAKDCGFDLKEADGYKGFCIAVDEMIHIYGYDARGLAAALFYLEDLMCMERAPFVKKGNIYKKPMLSPTMVHSGYGMEQWPDEYLMRIAHEGRDAILVFTKDVNMTRIGFLDLNDLIARASKFGIDVYAYAFMAGDPHPDDERAFAYYDGLYGNLFRHCPGLKGVTLVGEAVEFHSKDPHVTPFLSEDVFLHKPGTNDVPDGKFWPGWYPCEDLPAWLDMLEKIIRKEKADADIVLWTYNWGFQPEDVRVRLIENMPKGITLQATFEMFDKRKIGDIQIACADYSLSFPGPGPYFTSEAIAAKKRGIRLYAMTQSAGVTWDFGVVPYEPMPYQWMKRFENMRKAVKDWDLCGSMDTHHHGLYPSFISKFAKHALLTPAEPLEDILNRILASEFGKENLEKVQEGFKLWSEAITYYTPTEGDFEGPGRIGPAYPFCLYHASKPANNKNVVFGTAIFSTDYAHGMHWSSFVSEPPRENILNLRIYPEMESLRTMHSLMQKGTLVFESIPDKNEKLLNIINLGKYITNCVLTNIHAKEWYILKSKFQAEFTKEGLHKRLDEMEKLLLSEIENAKDTLPLVDADSRLGWEPTMEYLGDRPHIEWKIQQIEYVLNLEMKKLRDAIDL